MPKGIVFILCSSILLLSACVPEKPTHIRRASNAHTIILPTYYRYHAFEYAKQRAQSFCDAQDKQTVYKNIKTSYPGIQEDEENAYQRVKTFAHKPVQYKRGIGKNVYFEPNQYFTVLVDFECQPKQ